MESTITSAQYVEEDGVKVAIRATINGKGWCVPVEAGNTDYAEIMRQVEAGTLTIQDAD